MTRKWWVLILAMLIASAAWLYWELIESPAENPELQEVEQVGAYFPLFAGMSYDFGGEGNEFAPFVREVQFVEDNIGQIIDISGGTTVVRVLRVTDEAVELLYQAGEFYSEESLLDQYSKASPSEVILKAPLVLGTTWGEDPRREIIRVDQQVEVPLGVFSDVIVIRSKYPDSPGMTDYYYAKNIGLIKTHFMASDENDEYSVISYLQGMEKQGESGR